MSEGTETQQKPTFFVAQAHELQAASKLSAITRVFHPLSTITNSMLKSTLSNELCRLNPAIFRYIETLLVVDHRDTILRILHDQSSL